MPPRSCRALAELGESWGLGLPPFPPAEKGIGSAAPNLGLLEPRAAPTSLPSSGGTCLCWEVLELELRGQQRWKVLLSRGAASSMGGQVIALSFT